MRKLIVFVICMILLAFSVIAVEYVDEFHDRYDLGGNTFNSILYSAPMNYPYQSGNSIAYDRIDNIIVSSDRVGFTYEVEKGIYNAYFKEPANVSNLIMMENKNKITNATGDFVKIWENETINLTPILMQYYNGTDSELISNIKGVDGIISDNQINYSSSYTEVNDSVDMIFKYWNRMIKEFLYLKNLNFDDTTLSGDVNLEFKNIINIDLDVFDVYADPDGDGILTLQEGNFTNGHIEFRRKSDNETIWKMPEPKALDNESEIDSHYRVIRLDNQLEIYVQTNWTWLNDSARYFPIIIDPTTSKETGMGLVTDDTEVMSWYDVPSGDTTSMRVSWTASNSYKVRSYIELDFSSLGATSVSEAMLWLYFESGASYSLTDPQLYYCNDDFDEMTLKWSNQATEVTNCDGSPFEIHEDFAELDTYDQFNVTDEIQNELLDDQIFSIKMRGYESGGTSNFVTYRTKEETGTAKDPYLNVTYTGATCGISLDTNTAAFGDVNISQESTEKTIQVTNTGGATGNYTITGTIWDGATYTMPVGRSAFSITSGNYASKTVLTTGSQTLKNNVGASENFNSYLQLKPDLGDYADTYNQNITYTAVC